LTSILDIGKVADVLLLLFDEDGADEFGKLVISCLKGQGIPSVIGACRSSVKKKKKILICIHVYVCIFYVCFMLFYIFDEKQKTGNVNGFCTTTKKKNR